MATSTVGSGKDYSTLPAWWTAKKASGSSESAECYSGTDLGTLSTLLEGGDPETYEVYAASGHENNGSLTGGAYCIFNIQPYGLDQTWNVTDMRMTTASHSNNAFVGFTDGTWERCVFNDTLTATNAAPKFDAAQVGTGFTTTTKTITFENCIFTADSVSNGGQEIFRIILSVTGLTWNVNVFNCVVHNLNSSSNTLPRTLAFSASARGGSPTMNVVCENTIVATQDYTVPIMTVGLAAGTNTMNNNCSSDGSADDFGGSGHLVDKATATVFEDAGSGDFTQAASSPTLNAGKNTGATPDIASIARPQGAAYDMGAFETEVAAGGGANLTLLGVG